MTDYSKLPLHPMSEKLVEILCSKTQNNNPMFFRILLVYYFGQVASHMRASVVGFDSNTIPLNSYVINLSPSGTGKGYATSFIEKELLGEFKDIFLGDTFPHSAYVNMEDIALKRARQNNTDSSEEEEKLNREFELVGPFLDSFDSATVPAVKQHRHKLLLANAGSLNFQVDEMGANLQSQTEVLHTFLELYDLGLLKEKLIKASAENKRLEKISGGTPTNMLLFGTPTKLLDGARTEELFYELLDMGYARRCFFGYSKESTKDLEMSAADIVNNMFNQGNADYIADISDHLKLLAHASNLHKKIHIEKPELLELMQYRLHCERKAAALPEQQSIQKAELSHRYFKALKLAGTYAFIEDSVKITIDHLYNAIALTELSGEAFDELMKPEKNYMKLAKYLADSPTEVLLVDLEEDLPYYKGTKAQKDELINNAIGYGYKNNIIIKRSVDNGIVFLSGESLEETDTNKLLVSLSADWGKDYIPNMVSFDELKEFGEIDDFNWCNHAFIDNQRKEEKVIEGFNVIVLDFDKGVPISTALEVFKGIKCILYTTKRHQTTDENGVYLGARYRIILPTNYVLHFDKNEYKEFIGSIIQSIPIEIDTASNQRSKKWLTNNGEVHVSEGELFDVLPYIPQTKKNEERIANLNEQDMDRLEYWVMNNIGDGNRNNQLYNYACILIDSGADYSTIRDAVIALNSKIPDSLNTDELENTVLRSIATKML